MSITKLTVKPNESSTYMITVSFLGIDDTAFTPATCVWSLSDTEGNIVNARDRVSESPSTESFDFVLSGDDLIYDIGTGDGRRVFTVEGTYDSTYGTGLPYRDEVQFTIIDTVIDAL